MVGKSQSNDLKAQLEQETKAKSLEKAAEGYREELKKEESERKSTRRIAKDFGVDQMTLMRKVDGHKSIQEFNATKQKLTSAEEKALTDWVLCSAERSQPPTQNQTKSYANAILQKREGHGYKEVGSTWVYKFLNRHHKVSMHWSKALDTQRAQGLNPMAVDSWFNLVKEEIADAGVNLKNMYGMDESLAPQGNMAKECVVGKHGTKIQH